MPDPYQNPTVVPPSAPYTWVPPTTTAIGNGSTLDFSVATLVRGQFRNDLPLNTIWGGSVYCEAVGNIISSDGSATAAANRTMDWPVLAAFRAISRPSIPFSDPPTDPFVVQGQKLSWQIFVTNTSGNPMIPNVDSSPLSAITLTYSLTIDPSDSAAVNALDQQDQDAIRAYLTNPQTSTPQIDWTTKAYAFADVTAIDSAGNANYFPARNKNNTPVELQVTDLNLGQKSPKTRTVTIMLGAGETVGGYKSWNSIKIGNYYGFGSLKLSIYKAMLFDAARVNMRTENLPCGLLEYAFPVNFGYLPSSQGTTFPPDNGRPNFFVKMFSPEDQTGTVGMAHCLNLRFMIFSAPTYGLSGAAAGGQTDGLYYVVFVGPIAGTRTLYYALLPQTVASAPGRVVALDQNAIPDGCLGVFLQWAAGSAGASQPAEDANWTTVANYSLQPGQKPSISPTQGFVSELLWLHSGVGPTEWYRVIQQFKNNVQLTLQPQRSQLYTERSVLAALESADAATAQNAVITRHIHLASDYPKGDPLQADPLAVWTDQSAALLSTSITFGLGAWTLSLYASVSDSQSWANSHLFARFWFVPETAVLDPANPHQYRDQTEFYFQSDSNGTRLVRGTPTTLDQCIVSPPLPLTQTYLQLTRFIDGLSGSGGNNWKIPFDNNAKARLVVGLYAVSYPTPDGVAAGLNRDTTNIPVFTLDLDSQYMALSTSIQQIQSHALQPLRVEMLNSSTYASITPDASKPLTLTNRMAGNKALVVPQGTPWPSYSQSFVAAQNANNPVSSAFSSLLTLTPGGIADQPADLLVIPFTSALANKVNDYSDAFYADFVTAGSSLSQGRVQAGNWQVTLKLSKNIKELLKIGCDYRLEVMLVSQDGVVVERILRTPVVTGFSVISANSTIIFTATVSAPFLISGANTQMVFRLWCYPYSRDGSILDLTALAARMATDPGAPPVGARIMSFVVDAHTVQRLNVDQTDSSFTSAAFFENLQIFPTQTLGDNTFWYISDPTNQGTFVIGGDQNFPIIGTLYSPAAFIDLPQNMETRLGAAGLSDSPALWIRTVPSGTGLTQADEQSMSMMEDPRTGAIHLASDGTQTVSTQSAGEVQVLSMPQQVIQYAQLSGPKATSTTVDSVVQGYSNGALAPLTGHSANLQFIRPTIARQNSGMIGIVAQQDGSNTAFTFAQNASMGAVGRWIGPEADGTDDKFGTPRVLAYGLQKPVYVTSDNDTLAYVVGYADPGILLMREAPPCDASRTGAVSRGTLFVVDSDQKQSVVLGGAGATEDVVWGNMALCGKPVQTFAGALRDSTGQIAVAYALQGYDGMVVARCTTAGYGFGPCCTVVNLRVNGVVGSSAIACRGIALAHDEMTGSSYAAFWCAGKIMVAPISLPAPERQDIPIPHPIQLVAGSIDFSDTSNAANGAFSTLMAFGHLRVDQQGNAEDDVPQQRPGFCVSHQHPNQGSLLVSYLTTSGQRRIRVVHVGGTVAAPTLLANPPSL